MDNVFGDLETMFSHLGKFVMAATCSESPPKTLGPKIFLFFPRLLAKYNFLVKFAEISFFIDYSFTYYYS